ncbi:hypothetical protein F5Y15DRAFT_420872 [Xylariaceae sp. FL0016]|nr:hypothetical protein F5Y15DRAFT_420872 [Xylariaceae sp. FL0016]
MAHIPRDSTPSPVLGWDEEERTGLYSNELKASTSTPQHRDTWWSRILQQNVAFRRKYDLRRLLVFGVIIVTISMILFEVSHREFYKAATSSAIENSKGSSEKITLPGEYPEVPGQCTTWPVDYQGGYNSTRHKSNATLTGYAPKGGWRKPEGFQVKALVFYGRKRTVDFLDCYLENNLAENGGYLDEVWYMIHTDNEDDLSYLDSLLSRRSDAYKIVNPGECRGGSYGCIWDPVVEDDTIYIKIDDDIVFIHPDTIPQLVHTRIAEPHPFAVSANLVNSPLTAYKHYDVGAIHPFLPDPGWAPSHRAAESWRPSEKRPYPSSRIPKINDEGSIAKVTEEIQQEHIYAEPPYMGHPWLLLPDVPNALLKTPMGINKLRIPSEGVEPMYGSAWNSWMISSQQQYSLLQNLEDDAMWRYHFGTSQDYPQGDNSSADAAALKFADENHLGPGGEQLFDTQYVRYNLNFIALWGHDVRNNLPVAEDDEQDLTATIPERLQRPFVIDTRAVVGHLSFYPQHEGIRETDLIDRWRAFANDMVCTAGNQKRPFDKRCPGF